MLYRIYEIAEMAPWAIAVWRQKPVSSWKINKILSSKLEPYLLGFSQGA